MTTKRRRIIIALAVVLLPTLLTIVAVLLLPAERIGAFAAARAEAALDRDVRVRRFKIRLLPRPAIALEDVAVSGPRTGSDSAAAFASAGRIELRPKLLPLFTRKVVIDEIVLDRPRLLVSIAADGSSNLPSFEDTAKTRSRDAELRIRRWRLQDGTIVYRDARDGTVVRLADVDQTLKLSGSITSGELARVELDGELSLGDIDANLPGRIAWPVRDLKLRIAHSADLDRRADRLDLKQLTLTIEEVVLDLVGTVDALQTAEKRSVELRAQTGSFDVAQLIASLPDSLLVGESGETLRGGAGRAQLDATIRGRAGAGATPQVTGTLRLTEVALARGKYGTIADGVNGNIAFSLDSVSTSGIAGRLLGEPLRVAFSVHDFSKPRGRATVQTALALAQSEKLGLLPEGSHARGRITLDVTAAGALNAPDSALLNGQVALDGVELQVASLKKPAVVRQGRIELKGRDASTKDLRATIGRSDVAVDFSAKEFLPYALGDTLRPPTITFDARAGLFDFDEIFGVKADPYTYSQLFFARLSDRPLDGKTATQWAEEAGLGLPELPPVVMDGRIRAAKLVRGGMPFDSVDVTIAARGGELDVRAARFRTFGGGVHLTGRLGLAAGPASDSVTQPLALDYTVNDVTAQQFLQRFTNFRDHLTGKLLLAGSVVMNLDRRLLPERQSVKGQGTIAVLDGQLVNWPLLRALGDRIGRARFDTLSFTDWSGRYRVEGSQVLLEESMLESGEIAVRAAGSFDFNGTLDLGATLLLPPSWTARIPGAPAALLTSTIAGPDGRVPVGARIAGTARQPNIRLDLSEAGTRAANAAREAAQKEVREAAARAVEKVTQTLPPKDSVTATADSAKKKVEKEVVDRLRRLIRPRTPPPDTTAATFHVGQERR